MLVAEIAANTQKRLQSEKVSKERSGLPSSSSSSSSSGQAAVTDAIADGTMDGLLLTNKGGSSSSSSSSGGSASMPSIGKYLNAAGTSAGAGTGTARPSTATASANTSTTMMPSFGDEGHEELRPMKKIKTTATSSGFSDFSGW